ncbi:BURP domain-containing protein BNM2A-like isoform X2 [Vitis riparia]|nr:BURP domain-containing protein BNM2A-like isoform X2 [Vitis riparia]
MNLRFSFWSIFLHFLAVMCFHGSGAREMHREELMVAPKFPMDDFPEGVNILQLHSMDGSEKKDGGQHAMEDRLHGHDKRGKETRKREDTEHVHGHSSSHMDHLDPSVVVFFTMKDLKVGKTMPIYFAKTDPASSPRMLPKEEADSIPFSFAQLPHLLEFFSFSQGSPQARAMENTLRECGLKPIKGETKFCATSLESLLDFVHSIFGLESHFQVLTTSYLTKSSTLFQNYTFLEVPTEIPAPKMVACHTMPYPYAIFYCHSQASENKVFKVSLEGQNGDRVEAFAVCHLDTSAWSRDHVSFRVLGIEPGTSPVCHFFPASNLIWVPRPTLN